MTSQIKIGDLFLADSYRPGKIIAGVSDPQSRWNTVGMFDVDDNGNIMIFSMNEDGFSKRSLDHVLRNPFIRAVAYRKLLTTPEIRFEISKSLERHSGMPQTTLNAWLENFKGNSSRRHGYTDVELIYEILAKVSILPHSGDISMSSFQYGGHYDKHYGVETPLFPRKSNMSQSDIFEDAVLEFKRFYQTYLEDHPVQTNQNVKDVGYRKRLDAESQLMQRANVEQPNKKPVNKIAVYDASEAMEKRIIKTRDARNAFKNLRPKP